jgi:hypothetical protein
LKVKSLFSFERKYKYGNEEIKIEDDWYFDLGYHFAFAITVFTIVFIFSTSAPLIPVFGFLFFTFKVS